METSNVLFENCTAKRHAPDKNVKRGLITNEAANRKDAVTDFIKVITLTIPAYREREPWNCPECRRSRSTENMKNWHATKYNLPRRIYS